MLKQSYSGPQLPPGGQRVYLNVHERGTLWASIIGGGALCLALLAAVFVPVAFGDLPFWAGLFLGLLLAFPAALTQQRLQGALIDLRANAAVVHTSRLESLRCHSTSGPVRCYVAFSSVGEFLVDGAAFRQLKGREGRRYRIVYGPASRILFSIEPMG